MANQKISIDISADVSQVKTGIQQITTELTNEANAIGKTIRKLEESGVISDTLNKLEQKRVEILGNTLTIINSISNSKFGEQLQLKKAEESAKSFRTEIQTLEKELKKLDETAQKVVKTGLGLDRMKAPTTAPAAGWGSFGTGAFGRRITGTPDEEKLVASKLEETEKRRLDLARRREETLANISQKAAERKAASQRAFLQNELEAEEKANQARIKSKRAATIAAHEADQERLAKNVALYKQETQQSLQELDNKVRLENAVRRFGAESQQATAVRAAIAEQKIRSDLSTKLADIERRVAAGTISHAQAERQVADATRQATSAIIENSKALDSNGKVVDRVKTQHKSLLAHITEVYGAYQLLNTVVSKAKQLMIDIPEAGMQQERTRATLGAIFGSDKGFEDIKYLEELAQKAGQPIQELQDAYTKFAPSAVLAGATQEEVNRIFTDFTKASTVLHMSTGQIKSLYLALEQMYAKTTVQSEEIKKQLGNVLPGAVEIGAQAWAKYTKTADKSVSGFMEAMKKNLVITREFAPQFAEEYARIFAGPDDSIFLDVSTKLQSNLARLQNQYFYLTTELYERTKTVINEVVKTLADGVEALKNNAQLLLQVVELVSVSIAVRLAGAIPSLLTKLDKLTVLFTGLRVAALAQVSVFAAVSAEVIGLSVSYEQQRGIILEYKGQTASLTDVLEVLADKIQNRVITAYNNLDIAIGSFANKVRSGEYSGIGRDLLNAMLPDPGQSIADYFFNFINKFFAGYEATRQLVANKAISLENFFTISPYAATKAVDNSDWGQFYDRFLQNSTEASKQFRKDFSDGVSSTMQEGSRLGIEKFINQVKGKSYKEIKEALIAISNQPFAKEITMEDKRRMFASASDFPGVTPPEGNNRPKAEPKQKAKELRDAYKTAAEEIKNSYDNISKDIKEAIGDIDIVFKENGMTIAAYFSQKRALQETDIAIQTESLKAELALAEAQKDTVKAAKLKGDLIDLQIKAKKEDVKLTKEQITEEQKYAALIRKTQAEYTRYGGGNQAQAVFGGAQADFEVSHAEEMKRYAQENNQDLLTKLNIIKQNKALEDVSGYLDKQRQLVRDKYNDSISRTNTLVNIGSIGELEAMSRITAANEEQIAQLEEKYRQESDFIRLVQGGGVNVSEDELVKFKRMGTEIENLKDTSNEFANYFKKSFTDAFASAFDGFVKGTKTAKEAFKDMALSIVEDLTKIALKQAATAMFSSMSSMGTMAMGFFAADGAVTTDTGRTNSILTSPTYMPSAKVIPFASGGVLAGEAGAEAVMPLTRTKGGKLGVMTESGQSQGNVYNISVNVQSAKNDTPAGTGEKVAVSIMRTIAREEITAHNRTTSYKTGRNV